MSGPKRYRFLSDDEVELWRLVAQTTVPRPGSRLPVLKRTPAPTPPPVEAKPDKPAHRPFLPPYVPPQSQKRETTAPPLAPIERHYRRRVVRGQIGIERALDLHGLTQAEAHGALRGFLRAAQSDGLRLVLVVTGKGLRPRFGADARESGVLRRAVPHWLREPDLRGIVLGFEEASQPHGGSGALYIRLRQSRP